MAPRGLAGALGRWAFAVAMPGVALGVALPLTRFLDQVPSPPFVAAIFAVAWFSGFRPALLSLALSSVIITRYFLAPGWPVVNSMDLADLTWLAIFWAVSLLMTALIIGRGRAQARAAASTRRLRMIIDAAPTLIYYIDRDERFRFSNQAFAARYGLALRDVVGRQLAEVIGTDRAETLVPHLRAALAGRPVTFEIADGDDADGGRQYQVSYAPDAPDGRVQGVIAVASDLTEARRAEQERGRLLDLEQRRRHEAEAMTDLGRLLTQRLELDAVAHRIAELSRILLGGIAATAYRLDDSGALVALAVSGDMGELKAGGVVPPGAGVAGLAVTRGAPVTSLNVLDDPDVSLPPDTRRWVEKAPYRAVLAVPFSLSGRVIGAFAMVDRLGRVFGPDEIRLAEAFADHATVALENARLYEEAGARRREAEMLADLAQAVNTSLELDTVLGQVTVAAKELCGADLSRIALWNSARGGMVFRYTVGSRVSGHEDVVLMPGKGLAGQVLLTGQPVRTEDVLADPRLHPDYAGMIREEGTVAVVVAPIRMDGRVEGLIYCDNRSPRPFTERDEEVLLRLADHAAIALRNAGLYQQAERARQEAEGANRAKDEFLAVLSHELRTPLTSMLGWLRLLRSGQLSPERSGQALEVVERNTRIQAQLINDLLDVSRIIAGKLQLDCYEVELAPIVEEAVESSRSDAEIKGVRLEVAQEAAGAAVMGDPLRLGQIVSNLVTNAVKFTPGGGRVRVRLARVGPEAALTVTDSGIGIEPGVLPRIFDRFRQADSTITRRHGGLGLGLAIVRHLTELHGGEVSVSSPGVGQGATFSVRLPLATSTARGRGAPVRAVSAPDVPTRPTLAGIRVLVAEDHDDTADLMRTVLQGQGAVVRIVGSISAALTALAESDVDVLVSDIGMPDGTGYELVARVQDGERTSGRPAPATVAVTAFAGADDRERAMAAGFTGWAAKPIDAGLLVESVARAARMRLARL
jgi:PAS domain S-box-containing protein